MAVGSILYFCKYLKIPIISPGLIFVQKAVLLGLFLGELIFGGAYYWKEFCVSKWVGLDNKTATTSCKIVETLSVKNDFFMKNTSWLTKETGH